MYLYVYVCVCVYLYILYICMHTYMYIICMYVYIYRYLCMVPLPKYQEVFQFEVFIAMIMTHFILHIINIKRQILGLFKLFNPS